MSRSPRTRLRRLAPLALALALVSWAAAGCYFGEIYPTDPFGREVSLKDAQHRYTSMVRFGRFDKAALYVRADVREAFIRDAPDTSDLKFTDFELDPVELDADHDQATVHVTYTAYRDSSPVVFQIKETQYWVRNGITNSWDVVPSFDKLAIKNDAPGDPDDPPAAKSKETARVERVES